MAFHRRKIMKNHGFMLISFLLLPIVNIGDSCVAQGELPVKKEPEQISPLLDSFLAIRASCTRSQAEYTTLLYKRCLLRGLVINLERQLKSLKRGGNPPEKVKGVLNADGRKGLAVELLGLDVLGSMADPKVQRHFLGKEYRPNLSKLESRRLFVSTFQ